MALIPFKFRTGEAGSTAPVIRCVLRDDQVRFQVSGVEQRDLDQLEETLRKYGSSEISLEPYLGATLGSLVRLLDAIRQSGHDDIVLQYRPPTD